MRTARLIIGLPTATLRLWPPHEYNIEAACAIPGEPLNQKPGREFWRLDFEALTTVEGDQVRIRDAIAFLSTELCDKGLQEPCADTLAASIGRDLHPSEHDGPVLACATNQAQEFPRTLRYKDGICGVRATAIAPCYVRGPHTLKLICGGNSDVGFAQLDQSGCSAPRASENNRASAGRVLSAIFQDQRDSPGETSAALLDRLALAVGPRNLRAVADEPVVVLLDDSRELVSHCQSLLLGASAAIAVPLNASETGRLRDLPE
jgi:hypothetical protein